MQHESSRTPGEDARKLDHWHAAQLIFAAYPGAISKGTHVDKAARLIARYGDRRAAEEGARYEALRSACEELFKPTRDGASQRAYAIGRISAALEDSRGRALSIGPHDEVSIGYLTMRRSGGFRMHKQRRKAKKACWAEKTTRFIGPATLIVHRGSARAEPDQEPSR